MTGEGRFRVLDRGHRSDLDVEHPTLLVAADASAWGRVWRDHAGGDGPAVDWAAEWAALLLVGTRPTGGYGVEVEGIEAEGEGPLLRYRETGPGDEDVVIQSLTQPWLAVAVERDAAGPEGADLERVG
jgi:hypothetical protein